MGFHFHGLSVQVCPGSLIGWLSSVEGGAYYHAIFRLLQLVQYLLTEDDDVLLICSLDTFPYAGTTTTCESLYMGVPCITMAGPVHAHNVGVSLLTTVGEYLSLCVALRSSNTSLTTGMNSQNSMLCGLQQVWDI